MYYIKLFLKIYRNLTKIHRIGCFRVLILLSINSIIDVFGISLIIPVIISFDKANAINNELIMKVYSTLNFESFNSFQLFLLILFVIIFLLKNSIALYSIYKISKFSFNISEFFAQKQLIKEFDNNYLSFKKKNSNDVVRSTIAIPAEFSSNILIPLLSYFNESLVSLIIIIGLFVYNPIIFLISICALLPGVLFISFFAKKRVKHLGEQKDSTSTGPYKYLFMGIFTFLDLKLYKTNNFFITRTIKNLKTYYSVVVKLMLFESIPLRIIELSSILTIAVILFFSNFFWDNQSSIINVLIVYATASYRLMPSINRVLSYTIKIKGAEYTIDKLMVDTHEVDESNNTNNSNLSFNDSISLSNVSYVYEKDKILDNVSFQFKKGEIIQIGGASGSGKTTLVNIISRIIDDNDGLIKVDDVIINQEKVSLWQNMIAYVPQDFYLREGTIRNNIAFGIEDELIDDLLIHDCIKKANLDSLLVDNNNDINAYIQEFGGNISGGQRQRMAIARALYRNPKLLIFDEATSALDNKTEDKIFLTLNNLRKEGLTIIVISHRTDSSFKYSSSIHIENGKVYTV